MLSFSRSIVDLMGFATFSLNHEPTNRHAFVTASFAAVNFSENHVGASEKIV